MLISHFLIAFILFQILSNPSLPVVHILRGPIVSEVHVYFDVVKHVVRLYNSSGKSASLIGYGTTLVL